MTHKIRTSKISKIIASYLALQLIIATVQPTFLFALTGGPSQPEFNSFTPIGTSDMVNLSSGDFNYNIPIMDVGGYPLNLSYDSGITMDQEASWVGLGWNLNVGQINRQLRGLPDDFNGDEIIYENNLRTNFTAGINTGINFPIYGINLPIDFNLGVGMKYNNYNGITFNTNYGISFDISEQVSAGLNISNTQGEGATVTPTVGISDYKKDSNGDVISGFSSNIGVPFNSRQGLMGLNLSASTKGQYEKKNNETGVSTTENYSGATSSQLSFNDNLSFNPTSELSFINANLTLDFGLGFEIFGIEGAQGQLTGFGSIQALRGDDKLKTVKGFGYKYSENASPLNSMLDFNRENDRSVTKNTTMLPFVNQTYDVYSIKGQGVGGMFRPHRSQVGHVYDQTVTYFGVGGNAGFELGPGTAIHLGGNVKVNPSFTRSGRWEGITNPRLNDFSLNNNDLEIDYEPVYYKTVGELTADLDTDYTGSIIGEKDPIKMKIDGGEYNRRTGIKYDVKQYDANNGISYGEASINAIKRNQRDIRTQSIQMITYGDAKAGNDGQIRIGKLPDVINDPDSNNLVPNSHQIAAKVLKPDGSTYVFGEAAYNTKKVEATFALGNNNGNCLTGLVSYTNQEDSRDNKSGVDHFFNKIHTPAYAHSYLLSSVLSSDYEDITQNGPSDDDLGAYTKFTYTTPEIYNWRVPFSRTQNVGTFSQGLLADTKDDKGNYVYGEKELKYVQKIETKTHIAIFNLSDRNDAISALNEDGGINTNRRLKKIDKIYLYSKPEYKKLTETIDFENLDEITKAKAAIKIAHFEYGYDLCKNIPNHVSFNQSTNAGPGKLTLKKVYFTYRKSNMGKYTPYEFNYNGLNPNYHLKAYDVWGNFKPISGSCGVNGETTTPEFPFVQQDDKVLQDSYASAWTMTSIDLPSGGELALEYESDDYSHVQDKQAMQMFKVVGAGDSTTSLGGTNLYQGGDDFDFLYVEIDDATANAEEFRNNYLKDIGVSEANPMYFRFLLNMRAGKFDYVTGYALIDRAGSQMFTQGGKTYGAIRLTRVEKEGGLINSGQMVNPIAKAGWYFGRKNLNRLVYGISAPEIDEPGDLLALGQSFVGALGSVADIFFGPNQALRNLNCAREFKPEKSWVRLYHGDETKLGGGIRVKKIQLHDNWDSMTSNLDNPLYKNFYGQEYSYLNADGETSGVATFEPNGSKENPLIQPFYDNPQKLQAPKEYNYVEKPIGQSLYPSPTVTYGRVVTANLKRERDVIDATGNTTTEALVKHATGRVINEFYTSKDFPTISDYTDLTPKVDITGILGSILKVRTNKSLTYSQGFVIRTNDMNGKMRSQKVQTEGQTGNEFISSVEYKYNLNADGTLNNNLEVILPNGEVSTKVLGETYDMVQDFRSNYNSSTVAGVDGNLAGILVFIGILPVPTLLPVIQFHEQELKTVTTTKVINSVGILKEKIAYDLGSKVSTKNVAWDAQTGNVLLTKTINEYDDYYFNLNYPANWYYENMGAASNNLNAFGFIKNVPNTSDFSIHKITSINVTEPSQEFLTEGDELLVRRLVLNPPFTFKYEIDRAWVAGFNDNRIQLIDKDGQPYQLGIVIGGAVFQVYRSGYRNLQSANMASVTLQKNPIVGNNITNAPNWANLNVVNSSAVEYSDAWNTQCEFRLPNPKGLVLDENGNIANLESLEFNPYIYNAKGDWRAIKSYAYLAGRNNGEEAYSPRNEGFYKKFTPFYKYGANQWTVDYNNWTYASEVTTYSPYGAELENKDALGRFSSAQYGYRYTLPTAVGSNTQYQELAFDGFEDYDYTPLNGDNTTAINPHFGYQDEVLENNNVSITNQQSHSGRNSIKLEAGATAKIAHRVLECDEEGNEVGVPTAVDDTVCIQGGGIGATATIEVLQNDSFGSDGPNSGSITIVSPPSIGSASVNNNNTPLDPTDDKIMYATIVIQNTSLVYQICDANGDCDTATVNIIICEKN